MILICIKEVIKKHLLYDDFDKRDLKFQDNFLSTIELQYFFNFILILQYYSSNVL